MSNYEEINNDDLEYLKKHFDLPNVKFFQDVILKEKIGNAYFFLLPFLDYKKKIVNKSYFNINYLQKQDKEIVSHWSKSFSKNKIIEYLFLSDNPLSLIKYFSRLPTKYKNKNLLFMVPSKYNYGTIVDIKNRYEIKKVITVFDNKATANLFRIITNSAIKEKEIKISFIDGKYNLKYKEQNLIMENLNYSSVIEKFRLYNNIDHKKNKEYETF